MIAKNKIEKRRRLKSHIRLRITGTTDRPRLTVYRSLRHVYVQIIDDSAGKTLVSVSDQSAELREGLSGTKGQLAVGQQVGKLAAKKAREHNIMQVVFDRNGYLYHGVVKALADGAREGGLKF
jgi:large subunit ribosomal protein L18